MKFMGGVDLSDQLGSYYSCLRKTLKWYKKLFLHLFHLSLINAYILYSKFSPAEKKLSHLDFKIALCNSLINEAPQTPKPQINKGRKHSAEKPARLLERHFAEYIPVTGENKRRRPARDCFACNLPKQQRDGFKRKQTSHWCPDCQKPLCLPECFRVYHTITNYKAVLLPGAGENEDSSDPDSD